MSIGGYTFLFDVDEAPRKNVFFDPTRRRQSRVKSLLRAGLAAVIVWCAIFFSGTVSLSGAAEELMFLWRSKVAWASELAGDHGHDPALGGSTAYGANPDLRPTLAAYHHVSAAAACPTTPTPVMAAIADAGAARRVFGHIPVALDNATLSLPRSCDTLDVLMPDWITLSLSETGARVTIEPAAVRQETEAHRSRINPKPALLPVVQLDIDGDDPKAVLLDPASANRALRDIGEAVRSTGAVGACLDFDQFSARDLDALSPFFSRFQRSFRSRDLESCLVLPGDGDAWRDPDLTGAFDRIVLKLFRRAWVGSVPGPVAEQAWFEDTARQARDMIGTDRLVVALGNFAIDWTPGRPLPERLSYAEAMSRVAQAGGSVRFNDVVGNGFATYGDATGARHRVWILDAISAHNQLSILADLGVSNIAIWSLGTEDPGLWPLLASDIHNPSDTLAALSQVRVATYVNYTGKGPFLRVLSPPVTGQRSLAFSPATGRVTEATYERLPEPYGIERYGQAPRGQLVLTFDDGPDPAYTAEILDILKRTETPAAFFVVGAQVVQDPDLLVRMVEEGHEVGSHTFSHPHMDQVSRTRGELEHSMMRKLIAGYAGHDTLLYREPFSRAGGPIEESRVASIAAAQADGAIITSMDVVPKDWVGMTADEIVDHVVSDVESGAGNVLLLHDGGGDRTETVKALPVLIAELRARGYEFSSLAGLLGTTRAALMPDSKSLWPGLDKVSFDVMSGTWGGIVTIFWVVLALGLARSAFILVLVVRHRRIPPIHTHETPKVAYVVPAYNEENAVGNCLKTLLKTEYGNFEIIVVDDGSTDDTFEEVQKLSTDRRIRVFAQLNHGKWGALNTAIRNTDAEILVCIDADTQVRPDALGHLVKHFSNPRVGAVAGKVVVGNRVNLLTRLQALEYVTAQNFERRAHDMLNSMLVVPGALGAWRTEALRRAGMYSADTVTEDADMTVAVNRAGYRITYEDEAVAYTEVPETVRLLLSQRLRWSFGMFQTAWKHRGALRERAPVGLVSIPDLVIFGYLYALLAPVADFFLLLLVWTHIFGQPVDPALAGGLAAVAPVAFAYLALPLFEMFVAGYALRADKLESLWMLLLFPFQRFFYRQLLYYSVLRALLRALMGSFTGWGIKKRMRRDLLAMQDG